MDEKVVEEKAHDFLDRDHCKYQDISVRVKKGLFNIRKDLTSTRKLIYT